MKHLLPGILYLTHQSLKYGAKLEAPSNDMLFS